MMVNNHDTGATEYDEEGYRHTQAQVLVMNAYASKFSYRYGTILSELLLSDCIHLPAEESLLIDTKRTATFALRAIGNKGRGGEGQEIGQGGVRGKCPECNALSQAGC
jgi:hypothetical protein